MKKGFTLIELLAVIVILAVIALIATPTIIGLIDNARKEAFKSSAYGIVKAGEIYYSKNLLNGTKEEVTFTYTDGVESSSVSGKKLDYNGTKPKTGNVIINSEGQIAIAIHNGTYCSVKSYEESEVTLFEKAKEECKITLSFVCGNILIDERDWNEYATVQIGSQCWMAENLRYTTPACITAGDTWDDTAPHDACKSHTTDWGEEILYQWGIAMNGSAIEGAQGLCPNGWHIPTDAEWTILTNYVGSSVAGDKLKAKTPDWNGSNTVGFNALPAGYRIHANPAGFLSSVGSYGEWWASTHTELMAWSTALTSTISGVIRGGDSFAIGRSVRCLLGQ